LISLVVKVAMGFFGSRDLNVEAWLPGRLVFAIALAIPGLCA
jgi:hypothetical protein